MTLVQEEGAYARDDESVRGTNVLQQTSTELLLLQKEEELDMLRKMRDDARERAEVGVGWRPWSWWGGATGQDRSDVSRPSFWRGLWGERGVGDQGET